MAIWVQVQSIALILLPYWLQSVFYNSDRNYPNYAGKHYQPIAIDALIEIKMFLKRFYFL